MATLADLFHADGTEKAPMGGPKLLIAPPTGSSAVSSLTIRTLDDLDRLRAGWGEREAQTSLGGAAGDGPVTRGAETYGAEVAGSAPPPETLEVSLDALAAAPYAYLAGQAGTGKTFLARQLAASRPDVALCATTGIAAVNMGDATTINALLGYFDTPSMMHAFASGYLSTRLRRLRKGGVRQLVVDEVSMLDANQLTVLVSALDDLNLKKGYDASMEETTMEDMGDLTMKLLLVGDFAQLPPVDAAFAFEAPEWSRFATFKLDRIHRHDQQSFITALRGVRRGEGPVALYILEPRFAQTLDFAFPGTTIVGQNAEVDRINALRHAQLPGELLTWKTVRSGEQQKDWLRLIPEAVDVKVGALVMVLANRSLGWDPDSNTHMGYAYVNGDLGTVVGKGDEGISILLQRTSLETVIHPLTSEWKEPTGKKNPAFEVKGAVTRMPLRLAYATTVHKSQGLSLDQVQVNVTNWMFKKPGMLYVALSRCRTLEGLRIVGTPRMFLSRCTVDAKIGAFL